MGQSLGTPGVIGASCKLLRPWLQVLALRALGRLMVLSDRLALAHGGVLQDALLHWRRRPAAQVCEALAVAHDLVRRSPSRHRQLVALMEGLIQAALKEWAEMDPGSLGSGSSGSGLAFTEGVVDGVSDEVQEDGGGNGDDSRHQQQQRRHDGQQQQQQGGFLKQGRPPDLQWRCSRGGVLAALLPTAVACYCRLLATGRLQWSPATYRTLAMCLTLARGSLRRSVRRGQFRQWSGRKRGPYRTAFWMGS